MSRSAHAAIPARILAALLALGLSGAPALAVERLGARETPHRCRCPAGEHHCTCPICRGAARKERRAGVADLPACHRARALEAIARDEAREDREDRGSSPEAPCLRSACGGPDEGAPAPAGHETFVAPTRDGLLVRGFATPLATPAGTLLSRPREPETPPPRGA